MIYIITYNINTSIRDYSDFYEAIKNSCQGYYHALESTGFVSSHLGCNVKLMTNHLRSFLYPGDTLFIAEFTRDTNVDGWITKDFWQWYNNNIR